MSDTGETNPRYIMYPQRGSTDNGIPVVARPGAYGMVAAETTKVPRSIIATAPLEWLAPQPNDMLPMMSEPPPPDLPTIDPDAIYFGLPGWVVKLTIIVPPILIVAGVAWAAQGAAGSPFSPSAIINTAATLLIGWLGWLTLTAINSIQTLSRHDSILKEQGKRFDQTFQQHEKRLDQTWTQLQTTTQAVLSKLDRLDEINRKLDRGAV